MGSGRWRRGCAPGCATVVAEPSGGAARRSGDGRGVLAAAPLAGHAGWRAAAQAAVGSSLVAAHSAANTAGAFIPSAECGLRPL
jgi:hypothetical protein